MHAGPDPHRAAAVLDRLDAVRETVAAAEDDVLSCLVVTGEPGAQRVLDDWLDQVADTLRALGEVADELAPVLAAHAAAPGEAGATSEAAGGGTGGDGAAGGGAAGDGADGGADAPAHGVRAVDP